MLVIVLMKVLIRDRQNRFAMKSLKASETQIQEFILNNSLWSLKNNKLHREFIFNDFISAFGFMTQVALIAERSNHHPEWCNIYRQVTVNLTTHEANGISNKDFQLAREIDRIAQRIA